MSSLDDAVAALVTQAEFCDLLGSPFTARLLRVVAKAEALQDFLADLARPFDGDLGAAAFALRLAGAFHRRALDAPESALGALYPSVGGSGGADLSDDALAQILRQVCEADPAFMHAYLESPPQTNEVGRSGALIGGYLTIAAASSLPLRVLEIGASAGLNLGFDRFHYRLGAAGWGPADSPVQLAPDWSGAALDELPQISVASRQGCDVNPIDLSDGEKVRRLESYIWPDQLDRLARLRGAIEIARALRSDVEQASADDWLAEKLAEPHPGMVTVIVHSIMWQYMPAAAQDRIRTLIEQAGARASKDAPIAWLSMEPWDDPMSLPVLRLQMWPGGEVRDLADLHPHGAAVTWEG